MLGTSVAPGVEGGGQETRCLKSDYTERRTSNANKNEDLGGRRCQYTLCDIALRDPSDVIKFFIWFIKAVTD